MVLGWKFFSLAFFSDMGLGELLCVQIRSEFLWKFTISNTQSNLCIKNSDCSNNGTHNKNICVNGGSCSNIGKTLFVR
jgi:hypothetical protein